MIASIDTKTKLEIENEARSTIVFATSVLIFAFVEIFLLFLNIFDISPVAFNFNNYVMMTSSVINIIAALLAWKFQKISRVWKYVLMTLLILTCGVLDYCFSYLAMTVVLVPVILSTRYYDKKFTIGVCVALDIVLLISAFGVWITYKAGYIDGDDFFIKLGWENLQNYFLQNFVVKVVALLVPFMCCIFLSLHGKTMLAKQAKNASEAAILANDIRYASSIQKQVLPVDFQIARTSGINVYASMLPAREAAGDFYDFFQIQNKFYFLVADVSDKGLYSAMFMMNIKNTINSIAIGCSDLEQIVNNANVLMSRGNDSMMFVTLFIASYDLESKKLEYINAGHCPAIIKKKNGEVIKLENKPQPFLGIFPEAKFHKESYDINFDDYIYLYTDGVVDAHNIKDESFGEERLLEVIKKSPFDNKMICENINNNIKEFIGEDEQFDDITEMCVSFSCFDYDAIYKCEYENIDKITSSLNKDLIKNNVDENLINLLNSAIDDLLDNIISYAYEDKNNTFRFQYSIKEDELLIVVSDQGKSFNPLLSKEADLSENREIGGLGIHLIKSIMDDVQYARNNNTNILVLTKKLK